MIVSINQPAYMPWLGYFDRIEASDLHIVLDHVQFEKNSLVNRNKIRTPQAWTWLTVPLKTKGHFGDLEISKLRIADEGRWCRKHWNSLKSNYSRATNFIEHFDYLENFYIRHADTKLFLPIAEELNKYISDVLGVKTKMLSSSDMGIETEKSDLILSLCQDVGATTYLSGPFGRHYLNRKSFKALGIDVLFYDYEPQEYQQAWPGFESGMAAIDVLANNDRAAAVHIMQQGRRLSRQ